MIKKIKGNFMELVEKGEFDVIIHGCNCFGDMSRGINKLITDKFPEAKQADSKTAKGDVYKLGDYSYVKIKSKNLTIVNMYTQYEVGETFEYTALGIGLRYLANMLGGDESIGMPLIGCGVNRGKAKEVEKIIARELDTFNVTIVL